jgi:hypothetical protein
MLGLYILVTPMALLHASRCRSFECLTYYLRISYFIGKVVSGVPASPVRVDLLDYTLDAGFSPFRLTLALGVEENFFAVILPSFLVVQDFVNNTS